jgi:bifunctional non-homologous end joining protein LigD
VASHSVKIGNKQLALSNLDKVLYPETGFTKGQVIDFYTRVGPYILPHLKNRPITLKRFPNGIKGEHFYEKDAPSFTPAWIKTFPVRRSSGESMINYILINDLPSLVWSANMANLEVHPFLAKVPRIDVPTMVVFDLDPGEGSTILQSSEVAFLLKDLLDQLGLESLVKVSGSKGIHVHVPLNTTVTYEITQAFAQSVAKYLAGEHPELVVSEMVKSKRKGKVFIDWSQNSEHKSTVSVYSLRAKAERPLVAMPIRWDELKRALNNKDASLLSFEPKAALKRLGTVGDLFAPALRLKQRLPKPFLEISSNKMPQPTNQNVASLETYRLKRDFTKTREPPPSIPPASRQKDRLFVIQKHAASHLHYDFRLELGGTLKSWAVPKGPPYDVNETRLAMATEDHPMDYADFEGIIPAGEYGGGTVMVWDTGSYELIDGNYWQGKLHLFLHGKKLNGEWVLVKGDVRSGKGNVWYLIKAGSAMERPSEKEEDSSALTSRSMERIAKAEDAVWHSNRKAAAKKSPRRSAASADLESLPEIRVKFIEPMLSEEVDELPDDPDAWTYEIKLDGYRCLALRNASGVKLYSRKKNSLNSRFPTVVKALESMEPGTIFDGEIVALDDAGRPSFNLLQHFRFTAKQIHFYAFDILACQNKNVMGLPLETRRELLATGLENIFEPIRMSEDFDGSPKEIVAAAKELSLEGIIAKKKGSLYQPGKRTRTWLKYKINKFQPFVIGGYTPGNPFDALIVGYYEDDVLLYAAKVRNGFVPRTRREVARKFAGLEDDSCPFANLPERRRTQWALTREEMRNCVWLKPTLIAQIEFVEWTPDKHLRAAKFVGLRDDKDLREIVREGSTIGE